MVDTYVGNQGNKPDAASGSTNSKVDIVAAQLREFAIALPIIARCGHCKEEYKRAAMSAGEHPEPEVSNNQIVHRRATL
jgi:hypothetical protein